MTQKLLQAFRHDSNRKKIPKSLPGSKVSEKLANISLQNQTGTEYMELHGSTVIMASDDSSANPLVAVIVITSIFLFMTLSVTVAILVFCRKKNTVFVLQKCEQEDEISYELDDMNNTDIEFADFEGEHDAMQPKAKKSATCPNLLDSIEREDSQCLQLLLDTTESETDDSGKERCSPVHPKLKRRSKSFTFQGRGCRGYQQMVVTAVMETRHISKSTEGQRGNGGDSYCSDGVNLCGDGTNAERTNVHSLPFRSEINLYSGKEREIWKNGSQKVVEKAKSLHMVPKFDHQKLTDISHCFNDAKLAFLDTDTEEETTQSNVLPERLDEEHGITKCKSASCNTQSVCSQATWSSPRTTQNSYVQSNSFNKSCDPSSSTGYSSTQIHTTSCCDQQNSQPNPSSQRESSQHDPVFQTTLLHQSPMSRTRLRNCNHGTCTCTAAVVDLTSQNAAGKLHVNSTGQSETVSHAECDVKSQDSRHVSDKTRLLEQR